MLLISVLFVCWCCFPSVADVRFKALNTDQNKTLCDLSAAQNTRTSGQQLKYSLWSDVFDVHNTVRINICLDFVFQRFVPIGSDLSSGPPSPLQDSWLAPQLQCLLSLWNAADFTLQIFVEHWRRQVNGCSKKKKGISKLYCFFFFHNYRHLYVFNKVD